MSQRQIAGIKLNISSEIIASIRFIQKMIDDIKAIIENYREELAEDEISQLENFINEIVLIQQKYPNTYAFTKTVDKELSSPENEEYLLKYNKLPLNPPKAYIEFTADMQRCFEIEDEIFGSIVVRIWQKEVSKKANYANGDSFGMVVHSGYGNISLPGTKGYNTKRNTTYFSCSFLTDKQMDMFNTKVGMEFEIDADSLVCASTIDCVTTQVRTQDIYSLKKVGEYYINAGYSLNHSPITKLVTPKTIEDYCCETAQNANGGLLRDTKNSKKIINEVVIDKQNAKPKSIVLQTSGCRFDFLEYEQAKAMERVYGVPIKIINRSLYRKKLGLEPFEEEEKREFYEQLVRYSKPQEYMEFGEFADVPFFYNSSSIFKTKTPEEVIEFLNNYYTEVVEAGGFDESIKAYIRGNIDIMIGYARQKQREISNKQNKTVGICENDYEDHN